MRPVAVRTAALVAALLTVAGCAHSPAGAPPYGAYPAPVYSPSGRYGGDADVQHGVVRRIEMVEGRGEARGAGALVGGLLGAVVGRQFAGSSEGGTTGTVIGAMAGALLGHEIERQQRGAQAGLRVSVELDDGSLRSVEVRDAGDLRVGDACESRASRSCGCRAAATLEAVEPARAGKACRL